MTSAETLRRKVREAAERRGHSMRPFRRTHPAIASWFADCRACPACILVTARSTAVVGSAVTVDCAVYGEGAG